MFLCNVCSYWEGVGPKNNYHFENEFRMLSYQYMEKNTKLNHMFYKAMAYVGPIEVKRYSNYIKDLRECQQLLMQNKWKPQSGIC